MEFNPKDIKKIKEVLNFLNSEYKEFGKIFLAYHPRGAAESFQSWHICCKNYLIYRDKDNLEICYETIKYKYPKLKIIYTYLHDITLMIKKSSNKKVLIIK